MKELFLSLKNRKVLDFGHNEIKSIKIGQLSAGLESIETIILFVNPIMSAEASWFVNMSNLTTLSLSTMKLSFLKRGTFKGLKNLKFM